MSQLFRLYKQDNFTASGKGVDISDYVTNIAKIPLRSRNANFGLIAKEFKIGVVETYSGNLNIDARITIDDINVNQTIFEGIVVNVDNDRQRHETILTVAPSYARLKNYKVNWTTLHTRLVNNSTSFRYIATDNDGPGRPSVRLDYLLEQLFAEAGLTLGLVDVFERVVDVQVYKLQSRNFLFKHICLDENMMYAINQSYATFHQGIQDEDKDNVPSFFDLVSYILSKVNVLSDISGFETVDQPLVLVPTAVERTYRLAVVPVDLQSGGIESFQNFSNDDVFDRTDKFKNEGTFGYTYSIRATPFPSGRNYPDRAQYASNTNTPLVTAYENSVGTGDKPLKWESNLFFYFRDPDRSEIDGDIALNDNGEILWYQFTHSLFREYLAKARSHNTRNITLHYSTTVQLDRLQTAELDISNRNIETYQEVAESI